MKSTGTWDDLSMPRRRPWKPKEEDLGPGRWRKGRGVRALVQDSTLSWNGRRDGKCVTTTTILMAGVVMEDCRLQRLKIPIDVVW
jgi:hypothetical protein